MVEEVNEMISNTVAEGANTQKKENVLYAAAALGALTIAYGIVKGSKKLYKKVTSKTEEKEEPVKDSRINKAKETFVKAAKTAAGKARGPYKKATSTAADKKTSVHKATN